MSTTLQFGFPTVPHTAMGGGMSAAENGAAFKDTSADGGSCSRLLPLFERRDHLDAPAVSSGRARARIVRHLIQRPTSRGGVRTRKRAGGWFAVPPTNAGIKEISVNEHSN